MSQRFRLLPCEQRRILSSACLLMACMAFGMLKHRSGESSKPKTFLKPCEQLAFRDVQGLPSCTSGDSGGSQALTGISGLLMGVALDLNEASAEELQIISGIGPRLSLRITEDRKAGGLFTCLTELRRVRGIGPVLQKKAAKLLRIGK